MHQQVVHGHAIHQRPMGQQVSLNLLRRLDPLALSPLVEDRAAYHLLKRMLDVTVATLALVILSPLMALIAVLIALDSGWSVIFRQERVSARRWTRDGFTYWQWATFTCYKFRSMVKDADESVHQAFAKTLIEGRDVPDDAYHQFKANDPRVTRVGRLLRETSLDELPQLVNVLKGEMSLVGPRPVIPYEVAEYQKWHKERLAALPGITGLWQVSGRCEKSFDYMIRKDIEYVRNQSLWLDLKILFRTIPAILSSRGAG
jgi:lipopolysaccharide/colanic/teichoic acid biosynthesis glycosyltransferase